MKARVAHPRGSAGASGRERRTGSKAEHEEIIFIGPTVPLRSRDRIDISNEGSSGKNEIKLIFAPAAAALILEKETGKDSDSFANGGYDPDEARIPAGQPGGGQWTSADSGDRPEAHAQPHPTPRAARAHPTRKIISHSPNEPITAKNASMAKARVTSDMETLIELRDNDAMIRFWAAKAGVDPNLVRAILIQESALEAIPWGLDIDALASYLRHQEQGTYGPGQLNDSARAYAGLTVAEAMTFPGAIKGVALVLKRSVEDLHDAGVANPTVAQIAAQYNSQHQKGLVSNYGQQVFWIYKELQAGRILGKN